MVFKLLLFLFPLRGKVICKHECQHLLLERAKAVALEEPEVSRLCLLEGMTDGRMGTHSLTQQKSLFSVFCLKNSQIRK